MRGFAQVVCCNRVRVKVFINPVFISDCNESERETAANLFAESVCIIFAIDIDYRNLSISGG